MTRVTDIYKPELRKKDKSEMHLMVLSHEIGALKARVERIEKYLTVFSEMQMLTERNSAWPNLKEKTNLS